jgi:hypothetical protein
MKYNEGWKEKYSER